MCRPFSEKKFGSSGKTNKNRSLNGVKYVDGGVLARTFSPYHSSLLVTNLSIDMQRGDEGTRKKQRCVCVAKVLQKLC